MSQQENNTPPPNNDPAVNNVNVPQPPALTRKLVGYILGFGVSVAIGLAPYIGKLKVPGFSSLLELIPDVLHSSILPLSSALMGLVAVVIQWYGSERLSRQWLRGTFRRTLILTITSFIILFIIHNFVVQKVSYDGGTTTLLIGFVRNDPVCDKNTPNYEECINNTCSSNMSNDKCIGERVGISQENVEAYWGDFQIRMARIALLLPYLVFTGSFGLLIGLLLLKERLNERLRRKENK